MSLIVSIKSSEVIKPATVIFFPQYVDLTGLTDVLRFFILFKPYISKPFTSSLKHWQDGLSVPSQHLDLPFWHPQTPPWLEQHPRLTTHCPASLLNELYANTHPAITKRPIRQNKIFFI